MPDDDKDQDNRFVADADAVAPIRKFVRTEDKTSEEDKATAQARAAALAKLAEEEDGDATA